MTICPIHSVRQPDCLDCNAGQYRHDRRWTVLMMAAMGISLALPFPMNCVQFILCGLSLAVRVPRMLRIKK